MRRRFVYGPVPSRRLGRSLGVDLVPFKTCSYDCVYCQLGRTTNMSVELRPHVPMTAVLDELEAALRAVPRPDFIGLAGSGEPTLDSDLGALIGRIKHLTDVPVAVLTNGSLLWRREVREGLAMSDLVLPSLDAGTADAFHRVNRPHPDVSFELMLDGLFEFTRGFRGEVWLEVLIVGGVTDRKEEVAEITALAQKIRPARVQLNTVTRPPADERVVAASAERLEKIRERFTVPCEIIAEARLARHSRAPEDANAEDLIEAMLVRRPCTVEGISAGLGLHPTEVIKHLDALRARGVVREVHRGSERFYEATPKP